MLSQLISLYLTIIGTNESVNNQIMLKNLITTKQKLINFNELIKIISK